MGRPREEEQLVARARRGDTYAYEELVRMYQGIAFRTACLITGSAADAEEAAHDAFLKAYRALGRFRADAPFRPWLLAIVANESRNRVRSSRRRDALAERAAAEVRPGDAAPSPEAVVLSEEQRRVLYDAVDRLAEKHRLVVVCRYFLDLSEAETATVLGIRQGTVKSRLSRALDRLREEVGERV